MEEMKKCTQCGEDMPANAIFCPECGTRQNTESSVEEKINEQEANFALKKENLQNATLSFDPYASDMGSSKPAAIKEPVMQPQPNIPTPPQNSGFQYANPNIQPQQYGAPQQMNQPYPVQPNQPMGQPNQQQSAQRNPMNKSGSKSNLKKYPIFLLIVGGILTVGMVFWLISFFNPNLTYNLESDASRGVIFVLLLMTILAIISTVVLRVQLKGKKLAVLANVLLVLIIIAVIFGISMTETIPGDLPFDLLIKLVP